ncbi:IclR family transcriptional regulator domain-containing protein [Actinomadura hibisca]|uniref:IclR family transcriptional regulator domain-containing protein n=1 Tax=Actinomadura hibisca TaxID=68565 RepID=UPI0008373480|nr:IclR family transcriptional regulator C-terminal domain-containing protein [Actinomadura hibisca]
MRQTAPRTSVEPVAEPAVGPLERGLQVVRALCDGPQRPADLVRGTGLVRSTVDRVVSTLAQMGYVRWQGREVAPAPRLMELGNAYLTAGGLPAALAAPALELSEALDESVSLAVADRDGVRFVLQSPRRRAMSVSFRVGDLLPAELCAPGAIFAADWDTTAWHAWERRVAGAHDDVPRFSVPAEGRADAAARLRRRTADFERTGWAEDDQLIEPGLIAIAVPARTPDGAVACAVSVVSHTSRHTVASLREHALPELRASVRRMEAALAAPPAAPPARRTGVDRSREAKEELGPDFLQSLQRGLAVMVALDVPGGATIAEAAAATGLPRATARRALASLCALGYAAESGGRFALLPRVLDLGYAGLSGLTLEEIAAPHLRRLVEEVGDSASLSVLEGADVRYVARAPAGRIMSVAISVGTRFPAYATSMGRVLLAGLDEATARDLLERSDRRALTARTRTGVADLAREVARVRADGHALVDQELEEGLRSLAVPVRDRAGRVVAAANLAAHAGPEPPERTRERLLPALAAAARAIETDLAVVTEHRPR